MRYFVLLFLLSNLYTQQPQHNTEWPVPTGNFNQLFYLQRSHNRNTIVYELNMHNGLLDNENPIHSFWIRYEENAQRQELSYIQRTFAYGMKCRAMASDKYEVYFVSYKKYKMTLEKVANGHYKLFGIINKRYAALSHVFLKINSGGSFWSPNIEYVEIKGTDATTNQELIERVKI